MTSSPQRRRADRLCDQILEPALARHESRLRVVRGDRMQESGPITVQLIEAITDSRLVIVDLVDSNPNVYYELGIAEAFNKPLVRFSPTTGESLPFDVRDMRTIDLPQQHDGGIDVVDAISAIDHLAAMLPQLLSPDYKPVSIVALAERRAKFELLTTAVSSNQSGQSQLLAELAKQVLDLKEEVQRIRLNPKPDILPQGVFCSLGWGEEVLAKHLDGGVTVDDIQNELIYHPNIPSLKNIEIVLEPNNTKTLVLHGGRIHSSDSLAMSNFWEGFTNLVRKARLGLRHSEKIGMSSEQ